MDILGMLQNDLDELCEEDIEMIEQELNLGDYPFVYKEQCKLFILKARRYFEEKKEEKGYLGDLGITGGFVMTEKEVTVVENPTTNEPIPESEKPENKTHFELFKEKLEELRSMPAPEKRFIDLITTNDYVTNDFIDQHFKVFNNIELSLLLRNRQFDEEFLEKYFDALDKPTIIINQLFSEEFFMRHYADMQVKLVLTKSKNPWKDKSKRSSKLTTFLRLKGVKI